MKDTAQLLTVRAKPEPLSLDLSKTGVLVVDMQNDFCAPGGAFDRASVDIDIIRRLFPSISKMLRVARGKGVLVIYLKMEHQPDLSDFGAPNDPHRLKHGAMHIGQRMKAPNGQEGRFLIRGTWNTEIVTELAPQPGDLVVSKNRYSGFYETDLNATLKAHGAKYLIFTGCTTSVCVESTLRDAMFRGYTCLLLSDCTAEPIGSDLPRSNHEAWSLVIEQLFGWVANSRDFLEALGKR